MMWLKSKLFLFSLCLQLIFLTVFTLGGGAKAAANSATDGFIIQADRVVGTGMNATIIQQETSAKSGKEPMLRIQYQSATIYGMRLIKQVQSSNGMVSITLKAQGPVTVKGMTVDTTAMSFKGACLMASETVPNVALENVTMVAHYMDNQSSDINQLILNTVAGQTVGEMPNEIQLLTDLSALSPDQMNAEIGKISSGHLPLTCQDPSKNGGTTGEAGKITDPLKGALGGVVSPLVPVTKTLDPVLASLNPVLGSLNPVLTPLDPVLSQVGPVIGQLNPVLNQVSPVINQLSPVIKPAAHVVNQVTSQVSQVTSQLTNQVSKTASQVTNQVSQVTSSVTNQASQPTNQVPVSAPPVTNQPAPPVSGSSGSTSTSLQSACTQIKDAQGVITKELALNLINQAMANKLTLATVCQSDTTLTKEFTTWQNSLLQAMGLLDLLGNPIPMDPMLQLQKMKDQISLQPAGTILYKP